MLPKITISFLQGALEQSNATTGKVPGLVLKGVAVPSTLDLNTTYEVFSLSQAEALGITSGGSNDYAYTQIKGFYDGAGSGTQLFFMITDQLQPAALDLNNNYVKKLLTDSKGVIRVLGIGLLSSGSETIANGLDENAHLAVEKAQLLSEDFTSRYRPLRVVIGGNAFSGTPADLKDYKTDDKNRVAIFIGADDDTKTASIGKLIGRLASTPVQRKPSRVLDGAVNNLTEAYLTDGEVVEDSELAWDNIHDKGYIFYRNHVGRAGYYYTGDPTLTSGADDYNSLARGLVIDKAYVIIYDRLLNHLSDELEINTDGTISPALIKDWEGEVKKDLVTLMKQEKEISDVSVFIDHQQNVVTTNKLEVAVRILPVGYADFINVTLGYTLSINS